MMGAHTTAMAVVGWPKQLMTLGAGAVVLMLTISSILTWRVGEQIRTVIDSQIEVLTTAQRVNHFGTVLELSIKAVVATGDAEAAARYRTVQPQLRQTIHTLRSKLDLDLNKIAAAEVDRADLALVALEYEALELASRERLPEARILVGSKQYDHLLKIYYDGISGIENRATAYVNNTQSRLNQYLWAILGLSLASFSILVIGWLTMVRPTRDWAARVEEARREAAGALGRLVDSEAKLQDANYKLYDQARIDPLTKLHSRLSFNEDLDMISCGGSAPGESFSLVMCDVDHFKQYNDSYGHPAGDEVLRAVADAFNDVSRHGDRAYRYGGEEFVLILRTASIEAGTVCAERFRSAVEDLPIEHCGSALGVVTISMGVAQFKVGLHLKGKSWIERADAALYHAKRGGRNRIASELAVAA